MGQSLKASWLPAYLALGFVWGCSFLFIKQGLSFLTPFGVAFGRCALGAFTLFIFLKMRKLNLPTNPRIWLKLWIVSLLLNSIPGVLFAKAQTEVTSILAGIINATTPLMTLLVMLLIFREEKISRNQIFGLFIGALGILTVFGVWNGLGENPLWAVLMLLGAVFCYGISFPYSKRNIMPLQLPVEVLAATQLLMASLTLLPFYLFDGIRNENAGLVPIISMLALGIFGSGFAYIWNFQIIKSAGSVIASTVTYITPVVAVIMGLIFLGEPLTWNEPVGGVIVLLGAAISQNRLVLFRNV
ncbi:MAG: DMT family transporter [Candidatus Nanopelagicaceae bacterium]|nr:DMT family transporter [Candidatus Nanopelagicaceae bacterium]